MCPGPPGVDRWGGAGSGMFRMLSKASLASLPKPQGGAARASEGRGSGAWHFWALVPKDRKP